MEGTEKSFCMSLKVACSTVFQSTSLWASEGLCDVQAGTRNGAVWADL